MLECAVPLNQETAEIAEILSSFTILCVPVQSGSQMFRFVSHTAELETAPPFVTIGEVFLVQRLNTDGTAD